MANKIRNFKEYIYIILKKFYGLIRKPFDEIAKYICKVKFAQHSIKNIFKKDEKTAYIIRCQYPATGLMSYINTFVWHLIYAESQGYYPYIDMKNYRSTYQDRKFLKQNVWEYYFKEVYSADFIKRCGEKIYCNGDWTETSSPARMYDLLTGDDSDEYFQIFHKYVGFNEKTIAYFENKRANYFSTVKPGEKILGVVIRGTDLIGKRGHAIQPELEEYLELIKVKMRTWECNYVFVASEEQKVVDCCKKYIGSEKVIFTDAKRFDGVTECLGTVHFDRHDDGYLRGLEYLETIYMLSKCDCLIGTKVGATVGALAFRGKPYNEMEILDYGVY